MTRYIMLDGRALTDVDSACVLDTAESEEEAISVGSIVWEGQDAIWYDTQAEELLFNLPPWSKPKRGHSPEEATSG